MYQTLSYVCNYSLVIQKYFNFENSPFFVRSMLIQKGVLILDHQVQC